MDRGRLSALMEREEARFVDEHPRSAKLFERARASLLAGVPMPWMTEWAGPFPIFVREAEGARLTDVDGHTYVDLCLGDTGAMTGHAPRPVVEAIADRAARGLTLMLPTQDAIWVSEELSRRFGLPYWQFCLTATDANRFAIRMAREVTGRPRILVFGFCYHGTVDETFVVLEDGRPRARAGNLGAAVDPTLTTRVAEWNDPEGLERELAHGDVACVLAEPALTNVGIVLPEPGYHETLRDLTRQYGALLILDETHTLCAGPGGFTAANALTPDMVTVGKALAGGVPAAAYGMSEETAERVLGAIPEESGEAGIGGTLSGNALSVAAMRATLEHVLTEEAYARMFELAQHFTSDVEEVIRSRELPWHVTRLGCRAEYRFSASPPRTGAEAAAAADLELDRFMHLYALNRGVLLTPFHNMALMSPATTSRDVDLHTQVFTAAVDALLGGAVEEPFDPTI